MSITKRPVEAPTPFGRYQLLARLDKGGMGEVFLAVANGQLGFNKLVVIKRLLVPDNAMPEERDRAEGMFIDEARLSARLNHPNLVQTNEVGVERGRHFLTMEYLEGQSLSSLVQRLHHQGRVIPMRIGLRIIMEVLSGLHYAHDLQDFDGKPLDIIHRDLSPHNIFITYDGAVKIVDFGVAKAASNSAKTEAGILKGKFAYMAPEQLTGDPIDRRADLFVVGILLWELCSGKKLMHRENDARTVTQLLHAPIPRLGDTVPSIPADLDEFASRALARAPEDRFQTAVEFRRALEGFAAKTSPVATPEELAKLVSELFEERRREVRARIQECMTKTDSIAPPPPTSDLPVISAGTMSEALSTPAVSRTLVQGVEDTIISGSSARPMPKARRHAALLAVVGTMLAVGVAGIAMFRMRAESPTALASRAPDVVDTVSAEARPAEPPQPPALPAAPASVARPIEAQPEPVIPRAPTATVARQQWVPVPPARPTVAAAPAPPPPPPAPPTPASATVTTKTPTAHTPPEPTASPGKRIFNTRLE